MHKQKTRVKKLAINKVLIIMGIICTIFAVAIVLLPLLSNGEIELLAKSGSQMKENYATTETNTWDVSENGDGKIMALLDENGLLTISGTGKMKNWTDTSNVPWNSAKDQIKSVKIEEGVTSIGDSAFWGCISLINIDIPSGLTDIGQSAIYECSSLITIEIPASVTSIGKYPFYNCGSLTKIEVDENNKNYCDVDGVLYTKDKTQILRYPEAKEGNEYSILDSVTNIGYCSFYSCENLTSISIPSGVKKIESYAFEKSTNLLSIEIPSSVTNITDGAFLDCRNLTAIEVSENNKNYCDEYGVLYSKDKKNLIAYPVGKKKIEYEILSSVTSIAEQAFRECSSLTQIQIPEGLTSIGKSAFYNCSALTNIEIPEGVTSISSYTFYGCSSLESIKISSKVTSIGDSAFKNCKKLEIVKIPSKVTSIGNSAFNFCENLTSIEIPEGVTSIKDYTFSGCSKLASIEIPSKVTSIGKSAFHSCSSLISIEIPEEVTSIEGWTFYGCSSLESIKISSKVTSIGQSAFYNCSALTSIEIPEGVTSIKDYTFLGCSKLASIEIPSKVTSIGMSAFHSCSSLISIEIPEEVTSIEGWTFYGCNGLTSIKIPSKVTSIGKSAFYNCSALTNIEIPEGATSINGYAFQNCSSLRNIEIPSSITSIGSWVFHGCSSLINIEVNENNKEYCDENGILYTKDKTELIAYPNGKEETEYELPSSVTNIKRSALVDCENLINIKVNENNEEYCDENGVLFTKDKKKLVIYPKGKQAEEYKIPSGVTSIGEDAFISSILKLIEIPNTVTNINSYAFWKCKDLTSIKIPSSVIGIDEAFVDCDNLTIICKNDTTAEKYAKENEIKYIIIMDGVKPKTTASEIKAKLQTELQCEIVDLEEKAVTDTSTIGTGYKVKMADGEEYSIIVWGDFTGDGKISVAELARASRAAAQENGIGMKDKLILDVSGDGNIKINDLAAISRLATE